MGALSDLDLQLREINQVLQEQPDDPVGQCVYGLMAATQRLFELAASKKTAEQLARERNDIELAYTRIGRALSRMGPV